MAAYTVGSLIRLIAEERYDEIPTDLLMIPPNFEALRKEWIKGYLAGMSGGVDCFGCNRTQRAKLQGYFNYL